MRRPPISSRPYTLFPYTTLFHSYCVDGPGGDFDEDKPTGEDGNCLLIPQDGDPTATPPVPPRQVKVFSPNSESKSYTDILPSFNISWEPMQNLLVRGAVAKVVARPGYGDLAGARSLTFNRSEERRVGKECVRTGRYGWSTEH